jgi:4-hydroxy-4-methyl-2-oxoglutarate aldolase
MERSPGHGGVMIEMPAPVMERLPSPTIEQLRSTRGLTATVSDVLDRLGWSLTVPATALVPRHLTPVTVIGYAVTSEYLPARQRSVNPAPDAGGLPPPAFDPGYRLGQPGDVLVLAAHGLDGISVFGGRVATASRRAGLGGIVVDGAIRDLDEFHEAGLPAWSRGVTPVTGKNRLQQMSINAPVFCAGVQVHPGDLVIADASGVCFVPPEIAAEVAARALRVAAAEANSATR